MKKRTLPFVLLGLGILCLSSSSVSATDHNRTTIVGQPFSIPLYGAAWLGQNAATSDGELKELLKELIAEVKGLREDINRGATPAGTLGLSAPKAAAQKIDGLTALRSACASCHTGKTAKAGFLLFDDSGKPRELSGIEKRESVRRIGLDSMPPPPAKLTPEGKAALLTHLK